MIAGAAGIVELLALVDQVWLETNRNKATWYSEQSMFKVYLVGLLKLLDSRRGLWRYLQATPAVVSACGLPRVLDRRTSDRRLVDIEPEAERQIAALGLILSLEAVTDGSIAASDGSAFVAAGPVWHTADKQAGRIPEGLHGLDTDADWIQSTPRGVTAGVEGQFPDPFHWLRRRRLTRHRASRIQNTSRPNRSSCCC